MPSKEILYDRVLSDIVPYPAWFSDSALNRDKRAEEPIATNFEQIYIDVMGLFEKHTGKNAHEKYNLEELFSFARRIRFTVTLEKAEEDAK